MRNIFLSLFTMAILFAIGCGGNGTEVKTNGDYKLTKFTNNDGPKVTFGDKMMVSLKTFVGDSMVASSPNDGASPQEVLVPPREQLGENIPALFDAVTYLSAGDSALVVEKLDSTKRKFLPPSLANETEVRYYFKIHSVTSAADMEKEQAEAKARMLSIQEKMDQIAKDYTSGKLDSQLKSTASGLKTLIEDQGSGAKVEKGEAIETHYYGMLRDGKMFDSSFRRGQTLEFIAGMGNMIAGYDEAVLMLNHGGKGIFFMPSGIAYGDQSGGPIPPNSELIFYIEVL